MTKVVAQLAVNTSSFPQLEKFKNAKPGDYDQQRSNRFDVHHGDGTLLIVKGQGFKYGGEGVPVTGTVSEFQIKEGSQLAYTVSVIHPAISVTLLKSGFDNGENVSAVIFKGNDSLDGSRFNDNLNGRQGHDTIKGADGNDFITGGPGQDFLVGGPGADKFVYNSLVESTRDNPDIIDDFNRAQNDKIDLSRIDTASAQKFVFIGTESFADYRHDHPNAVALVRIDPNQDLVEATVFTLHLSDLVIKVFGTPAVLEASDFIL